MVKTMQRSAARTRAGREGGAGNLQNKGITCSKFISFLVAEMESKDTKSRGEIGRPVEHSNFAK